MIHSPPFICVFTDHSTNAFRSVLKGISFAASERGWAVRTIELCHSKVGIRDLLREWQPIGSLSYYLAPSAFPRGSVCVHVNPKEPSGGAWTVRHDSRATGDLAAHSLLKLSERAFAFVGDPTNALWSRMRGKHFVQTLARYGLGCRVFDPVRPSDDPLGEVLSLRRWIDTLERPCAVFAANDRTAESVLTAALDAGLRVPDDMAILGVDNDTNLCENAPVTLSSIMPDFFHGGTLGCEMLARRISGPTSAPLPPACYGDLGVTIRSSTRLQLRQNAWVAQMREFIRLHAAEGVSAVDVVRMSGRPRRGVELAFKAATGNTIGEELQGQRLDLAQRALADESIQIGEIPGLVGYVSQNQLERLFKRACGMTMRDYRRARMQPKPLGQQPRTAQLPMACDSLSVTRAGSQASSRRSAHAQR